MIQGTLAAFFFGPAQAMVNSAGDNSGWLDSFLCVLELLHLRPVPLISQASALIPFSGSSMPFPHYLHRISEGIDLLGCQFTRWQ